MASFRHSSLIFVFLFFSAATISLSSEPPNKEVQALIAVRDLLIDPHGALSKWDETSVDPCSWFMITCSSENRVIGLGAPSQSLSGHLSSTIGNLTNLQQIFLQNNNIAGKIPSELGLLIKLQTMDLSNNRFSGSIPNSLGRLSNLRYLRLNNNSLSGSFPLTLSKIPQLSFLDFSYNNFSGPVPSIPARTFNVVGNPLICGEQSPSDCYGTITHIPLPLLESNLRERKTQLATVVGTGTGVLTALLLLVALALFIRRRRRFKRRFRSSFNDMEQETAPEAAATVTGMGNVRWFRLRELQTATENFSSKNFLGKGGFGNVYQGRLEDGTEVAVKRLRDGVGDAGEAQFRVEVELISLAVHRNLLRLVGYCAAAGERLLVYPFMANGSVAARLRDSGKPPLDWASRKRIAWGVARALTYLHEQCDPKIIHRDVKAANVLLDDSLCPVVGDFGLAKLLHQSNTHVTTAVRGTAGHIAPEYLSTGHSSVKTDVFGFGVFLLDLISGPRPVHRTSLLHSVLQERRLEVLVDGDLWNGFDRMEALEMARVALLCTQQRPARRPFMSEVLAMLEGEGLAEKWETSRMLKEDSVERKCLLVLVDGEDDCDPNTVHDEVEEMELSGPR